MGAFSLPAGVYICTYEGKVENRTTGGAYNNGRIDGQLRITTAPVDPDDVFEGDILGLSPRQYARFGLPGTNTVGLHGYPKTSGLLIFPTPARIRLETITTCAVAVSAATARWTDVRIRFWRVTVQGPEGPRGPQGEPGAAGAAGARGAQGPAGSDGAAGARGPAGADGAAGATGPTGPQGPKGDKGDTGDTGPQGPPGSGGGGGTVADGSITTAKLANDAVTNAKLDSGAVDTANIRTHAVTAAKIATNAVGTTKISDNSVTNAKIADDAIGNAQLANNAVGTAEIANNAVTAAKIANNSVGISEISANAVGTAELVPALVNASKIAPNAVIEAKIADNAVTPSKLDSGTDTKKAAFRAAIGVSESGTAEASHPVWPLDVFERGTNSEAPQSLTLNAPAGLQYPFDVVAQPLQLVAGTTNEIGATLDSSDNRNITLSQGTYFVEAEADVENRSAAAAAGQARVYASVQIENTTDSTTVLRGTAAYLRYGFVGSFTSTGHREHSQLAGVLRVGSDTTFNLGVRTENASTNVAVTSFVHDVKFNIYKIVVGSGSGSGGGGSAGVESWALTANPNNLIPAEKLDLHASFPSYSETSSELTWARGGSPSQQELVYTLSGEMLDVRQRGGTILVHAEAAVERVLDASGTDNVDLQIRGTSQIQSQFETITSNALTYITASAELRDGDGQGNTVRLRLNSSTSDSEYSSTLTINVLGIRHEGWLLTATDIKNELGSLSGNNRLPFSSIYVPAGSVDTAELAAGSVTSVKLADDAVTSAKLADGAVTRDRIASGAINFSKIENASIGGAKLIARSVGTDILAADSVTNAKIADNAVGTAQIADDAVTEAKLANGIVDRIAPATGTAGHFLRRSTGGALEYVVPPTGSGGGPPIPYPSASGQTLTSNRVALPVWTNNAIANSERLYSTNWEPTAAYTWSDTGWTITDGDVLQFVFEHYGGSSNARTASSPFPSSWLKNDFGAVTAGATVARLGTSADSYIPIHIPEGILAAVNNVTVFLGRSVGSNPTLMMASSYYATSNADRFHPFQINRVGIIFN